MAQNYGCLSFISIKCKKCFPFISSKDTKAKKTLLEKPQKKNDVRFRSPTRTPSPSMATKQDVKQRKESSGSEKGKSRKKSTLQTPNSTTNQVNSELTTTKSRKESTSVMKKMNDIIDWEMQCKPKFHARISATSNRTHDLQQGSPNKTNLNRQRWKKSMRAIKEQELTTK